MKTTKKIFKIVFCLILIVLFLLITLSRYADEKSDISRKIGQKIYGGTLSTLEYANILKINSQFYDYIKEKDYNSAYGLCPYNYKQYKDFDTFMAEVSTPNSGDVNIKEIIRRTERMYSIILNNDEEHVVIFNEKGTSFTYSPEPFLEYKKLNKTVKKKKVKYEIISTTNYVNKFVVEMKITNLDKKNDIDIKDITLVDENERKIKGNFQELKLRPLETKSVLIEYETDINIPIQIDILRQLADKQESLTIDINK